MGSDRVLRAAAAAEQLCATLWEALRERAEEGDAQQVGALSRRIVEVCGSLTDLADAASPGDAAMPRETSTPERSGPEQFVAEQSARAIPGPTIFPGPMAHSGPVAVPGPAAVPDPAAVPSGGADEAARSRWPGRPVALVDEQDEISEAIEIKDVRSGAHPPVTVAIQRRLERFADDRTPFTVLLVEVLDAERLRSLRASGELLRELWAIESAIGEQLRPADTLLREIDGRWWLIAPDTDSFAARELAERLASAARRFAHRGTPLGVVVGIAVCPEHGLDAATLIGHADIDLYAAQAAGRSVGGFDGEDQPA